MRARNIKYSIATLFCATAIIAAPTAMAQIVTFDIQWTACDANGNFTSGTPTAYAALTMDTKYVLGGGAPMVSINDIKSLTVTVTGSGAGDGTFGKNDFTGIYFDYDHALNFSGQLIGQYTGMSGPGDFTSPFGTQPIAGQSGEFGVVGKSSSTPGQALPPTAIQDFVISTNGTPGNMQNNQLLRVSSMMASAVPETPAYAMMLGGLGLIGYAARRRSKLG